jgi:predicted kinase
MNDPQLNQLIMLCGIPTSGKTTYLADQMIETGCFNYVVLSTDSYIDNRARDNNLTYDEAFNTFIKDAQRRLTFDLERAIRDNQSIVWDQTNLTPKARKGKLALIPAHYKKVAIWFDLSLEDALIRNQNRPGKIIPPPVLKSMFRSFTPPALSEGFDEIIKGN